jgi:hypothetical protein
VPAADAHCVGPFTPALEAIWRHRSDLAHTRHLGGAGIAIKSPAVLREIGVDYPQGYLFYLAVTPQKLLELIGLGCAAET